MTRLLSVRKYRESFVENGGKAVTETGPTCQRQNAIAICQRQLPVNLPQVRIASAWYKLDIPLPSGIYDPLYPSGKGSAFVKPQKSLGLRSRAFLGFTQALPFPAGYNYIPLGRDISYTYLPLLGGC